MILGDQLQSFEPSLSVKAGDLSSVKLETISHFKEPKSGSFVFAKKAKFLSSLLEEKIPELGLVIQADLWEKQEEANQKSIIDNFHWVATVENVDHAMTRLSKPFYDQKIQGLNYYVDGRQMGTADVHPEAEIAQGVFIGENCKIGAHVKILPGVVIMPEVEIADHTIIYPNVNIYPFTKIGSHCRIHSGTVIGCDGFGYNFFEGHHQKVWHFGGVEIGDHVEIGCHTMIDMGTFSPTRIGDHSRIDNDVQISHNVQIHKNVLICGKTGIAGSAIIEDYSAFGAMAGVGPSAHLEVGAQVAAKAVVSENARVRKGETVAGHPARPLKDWLRSQATLRSLTKKKD